MKKIGVILAPEASFSPHQGGALYLIHELFTRISSLSPIVFTGTSDPNDYGGLTIVPLQSGQRTARRSSFVPKAIRKTLSHRTYLAKIAQQTREEQLSQIHVINRPRFGPRLREQGVRCPIIQHIWNENLASISRKEQKRIEESTDLFLCVSNFLANKLLYIFPNAQDRIKVIPGGIDTTIFAPSKNVSARQHHHLLFVGRLIPEKGPDTLLEAIPYIHKHVTSAFTISIVGGTSYGINKENNFLKKLRALEIEHKPTATLPGPIARPHLPEWYRDADIFISPSRWEEPLGMMNAEAMACGTPVVSTRRGGIPEVVSNAGVLLNPDDPEELGYSIGTLLNDSNSLRNLSRRSRERIEDNFSWSRLVPRYEHLFSNYL